MESGYTGGSKNNGARGASAGEGPYRAYGYRWVVLAAFGSIAAVQALLWLSFAPIESAVQTAIGVSATQVRLLALAGPFMFIILASYAGSLSDNRGFRFSTGVGAVMLVSAGAVKAVAPHLTSNGTALYGIFLAMQVLGGSGAAFALVNLSKMPIKWFPERQRVFATGLATMGMYLGTALGLPLVTSVADVPRGAPAAVAMAGLERVLLVVSIVTAAAALAFFVFAREDPPTPAGPVPEAGTVRLRSAFPVFWRSTTFRALCLVSLAGYGIYIGVTVTMEKIITFHGTGFSAGFASLVAGFITLGGIIGAVVMPAVSERLGLRRPFLLAAAAVGIPGLLLIGMVPNAAVHVVAALVTGFFLLPALPLTFTIVGEMEEIGPRLAATATGTLLSIGSVGSVAVPLAMELFARKRSAIVIDYRVSVLVLVALAAIAVFIVWRYVRETGPGRTPPGAPDTDGVIERRER